ncbi:hypothetical protein FACS189425_07220 [Clostridia bacterium]|nr:hypothetical protein FACS189425_07220 [Clostridia bacterium]
MYGIFEALREGTTWSKNPHAAVRAAIEQTDDMVSFVRNQIEQSGNGDAEKHLREFAKKTRSLGRLTAFLTIAASLMIVPKEKLDVDPFALNTPVGVYDLRTGRTRLPEKGEYFTKVTAAIPVKGLNDEWESFLLTIAGIDVSAKKQDEQKFEDALKFINLLQQIAGMALIGRVYSQNLLFALGDGANGKSTFFNSLANVLGTYAGMIDSDIFIEKYQGAAVEKAERRGCSW